MSDSDFIREVDQELRDEQLKSLWDRFGPFVIGFALLIVVGTAANKGYDYWRETQAAQSGDAFLAAVSQSEEGNREEAIAALEKIEANGSGGYPILAEMRIASEKAAAGNVDEAITLFEDVASRSGVEPVVQDLARIRANILKLDKGLSDEVILELTGLMDNNGFRHSARELVLLAHLEKQEFDKALPIADRIMEDAETPSQMRQRAQVYDAYIRSQYAPASEKAAS